MAVAYDNPIPGWRTPTVTNLRLWDAEPLTEFDLEAFNAGEYDVVSLWPFLRYLVSRERAGAVPKPLSPC